MFEFQKLCREYEKLSYDERRALLEEDSAVLMPVLGAIPGGAEAFAILVLAACAADGKLSVEEYSLFKDVMGIDLSFDASATIVECAKGKDLLEAADAVVDLFGALSMEIKQLMVSFCLCFCAADGRVSMSEKSFIKKLIRE